MKNEITDVFYDFQTNFPEERIANISQLLSNYPVNYGMICTYLYPAELKKLSSDFPEFNFINCGGYCKIYCKIFRKLC